MPGFRRQQAGSPEHYLSVSFVISAHDTNQTSKQIGPARVCVLNPGRLKPQIYSGRYGLMYIYMYKFMITARMGLPLSTCLQTAAPLPAPHPPRQYPLASCEQGPIRCRNQGSPMATVTGGVWCLTSGLWTPQASCRVSEKRKGVT